MSTSDAFPPTRPHCFTETECHDIARRLHRFARGGGETAVNIVSRWTGNTRWARNQVSTSGEDCNDHLMVWRGLDGFWGRVELNDVRDEALVAAVRQAERLALGVPTAQRLEVDAVIRPDSPFRLREEPYTTPPLVFATTEGLDAGARATTVQTFVRPVVAAGMLSSGYIEVSATSKAAVTSWGYASYYQYTWAQCSVTVRDPKGVGSGWAGVDWPDWNRIDGETLVSVALDKCLKSRNPVAVEPGRYTTILEPQAVCDFVGGLLGAVGRAGNETSALASFHKSGMSEPPFGHDDLARSDVHPSLGLSRLGEKVIDERITISANPMDPDLAFPPYQKLYYEITKAAIYHPGVWIEHGIYKGSYGHDYAVEQLGRPTGLPASGAFRMSGGETSIAEMIATTQRGLLVTHFDQVDGGTGAALMCRGYTRDGLWLIENGKVSKPAKNMVFVESILFALNNVEQLGPPQRVYHPIVGGMFEHLFLDPEPVIVPPLKVRDFSFTALSDAV